MAVLLSRDAPRSDHDPELAQTEASGVARHPVTGTFAKESHEAAFRAQIFRSAYVGHVLLMTLSLAVYIFVALVAPPDLRIFWSTIASITAFFTFGRVLLHHMEDTQRSQRVSSWAWTGFLTPSSVAVMYIYVVDTASTCSQVQLEYFAPLTSFATALINGSHGLGFVHKLGLIGLLLVTDLVLVSVCGELALALALCNIGALVVGSATAHMVEVYLRRSYADKVQDKRRVTEEKRRLEERNEQLQTSNERLLYDMQLRARSLDEDGRSAIRRGLQAGASQPHQPAGDEDTSEAGGRAPSGAPPPSLPPGAPSSTTSGPSDSAPPSLPPGDPPGTAASSTAPSSTAPPVTETDGDLQRRAESAARPQARPAVVQHEAAALRTWRRGDRARRAQRLAESANVVGLSAAPRPSCGFREGASSGGAAGASSRAISLDLPISGASSGQLAAEALADMANPGQDEDRRVPRKRTLLASGWPPLPLPEGVYASGGGFGAELQKGGKRLCQEGFPSPAEAAQARAMWKQGIETGCWSCSANNSPGGRGPTTSPTTSACLALGPPSSGRVSQQRAQAGGAQLALLQRSSGEDSGDSINSINSVSALSDLQEKFVTHVMCDYTPRPPRLLPMKQWVSHERLIRQLQPHAPAKVAQLGNVRLKQLITDWFTNDPAFVGLPFSAWCKLLKDKDPQDGPRRQIHKFSFEYTPTRTGA